VPTQDGQDYCEALLRAAFWGGHTAHLSIKESSMTTAEKHYKEKSVCKHWKLAT
jgi:hypothetical protein